MEDVEYMYILILDLFKSACMFNGKYHHMFNSLYEETQEFLINIGLIKEEDCEVI